MSPHPLETFVTRTRLLCEAAPPETLAETTPIVDMLLSALGWNTVQDCRRNVPVAGTTLEYVCSIETTPALFVAVDPASAFPSSDRLSALGTCLTETGIDRAIYTDGREAVLLAGTGSIDTHRCDLRRLETLEPLLEHYQRRALERRLGRHSRATVARRLAVERAAVRETLVDDLEAVTGSAYTDELEAAVGRLLDHLVGSFSGTDAASASPSTSGNADGGTPTFESEVGEDESGSQIEVEDQSGSESDPLEKPTRDRVQYRERSLDGPPDERPDADDSGDGDAGDDTPSNTTPSTDRNGPTTRSGGEYVARFFADHGSIGAIGHGSSTGALVHAAEFLLERGLSGVRVPWPESEPEAHEAGGTLDLPVLVDRDGASRLSRSRELSNGYHLNTAGSPTDHAARVEALGARAGYRVMLTGDWK
ncbi:hypothetical protein [Natronosalvus caseinilyticus]|uniref:hypothetical protein n=1 Tax=Natronosalvus caseinilyticus TaxID=2953747 RepID=UPI0028AAEC90|nr:hypothetical protein [Natronosalvus caseinilyticus]